MNSICVFCGSQTGTNPAYAETARKLGRLLAKEKISLVFGGGGIGLMGILADAVMQNGGHAIGVIPRFLSERELGHNKLSELLLVDTMHQRKQKMAELADGFLALPGGFGTLEELCEILTWRQLKLIEKPIGVVNSNGFFNHFHALLDKMVEEGFLATDHKNLLFIDEDPLKLIESFRISTSLNVVKGNAIDKT
jgi:uncharacterized protein (TIGR00730 family)